MRKYRKNLSFSFYVFTLEYWKEGSLFVGYLKEIPSVVSQGLSLAELKANIYDAYVLLLKDILVPLKKGKTRKKIKENYE